MDHGRVFLCDLKSHETIPIDTMHVSIVVTNKCIVKWQVFIQALQKYNAGTSL